MIVPSNYILTSCSCSQEVDFNFLETKSFVWKHFGKLFNNTTDNQVDGGYNFCNVCFKGQQSEYRSKLLEDVSLKARQQILRSVLILVTACDKIKFTFPLFAFKKHFVTSNRLKFFSVHKFKSGTSTTNLANHLNGVHKITEKDQVTYGEASKKLTEYFG